MKDIFNAYEFILFFQASPNKILELKSEKCIYRKYSNIGFTVMSVTIAVCEMLPLLVMGKNKNPRCFTVVKVFAIHLRTTSRKLDGLMNFHRLGQTVGSKVSRNKATAFLPMAGPERHTRKNPAKLLSTRAA